MSVEQAIGGFEAGLGVASPRREILFRRRVRPWAALVDVWRSRELVVTLAERDLRARYKQAFLGLAWAVLTPVVLMLVFTIFFKHVAHVKTLGAPYPLFAYIGLVPWTFFSTCVATGGSSLVSNVSLLNKIYCPREVFPFSAVIVAGVDAVLSLFVLAILFVFYGFVPKTTVVWVPVLLAVQLAFTIGMTLLISIVLVYLRDLRHALPLLLQLGLFATPVAYGIDLVSRNALILYSFVNPLAPVIDGYRRTVLYGLPPRWSMLLAGAVTSVVLLVGGYITFKKLEGGIADVA